MILLSGIQLTHMLLAIESSKLNTFCYRGQTGAVIVAEDGAVVFAYNRMPVSIDHRMCVPEKCPREGQKRGDWSSQKVCPVIHAERGAIYNAAKTGLKTAGAAMYCTYKPCMECAVAISEADIETVYFLKDYKPEEEKDTYDEVEVFCSRALIRLYHAQLPRY